MKAKSHVKQLGNSQREDPLSTVDSLLSELDRAGYFGLRQPLHLGCTRLRALCHRFPFSYDLSYPARENQTDSCTTTAAAQRQAPSMVLERRIDEVLGSGRWTGR